MTSPGTILMAKMLVPETEVPATEGTRRHAQRRAAQGREPHRRHRPRHHRRRQAGPERGHHAHQLPRPRRTARHAAHWVHGGLPLDPRQPRPDPRLRLLPRRVAHRRSLRTTAGAIGNLLGTRMALNEVIAYIALGAQKASSLRAPSPSPPSPCADSPTSAPSACRSAASARWSPNAATTSPS